MRMISGLRLDELQKQYSDRYGDIYPVHPVARSLCNLETIIGQLYPATLLARLVTLELEGRRR